MLFIEYSSINQYIVEATNMQTQQLNHLCAITDQSFFKSN